MATHAHLGVHVTLDLGGQARFGPDVCWVDGVDYSFDDAREPLFYEAVRHYYPQLKDGSLQPGYTGIRPKISGAERAGRRLPDSRVRASMACRGW